MRLHNRIGRLERAHVATDDDPRLSWTLWPGPERAVVLALVDFVAERAEDFPIYGGPESTPGFDALPELARALLRDLWRLWGASRRFSDIVASLVNYETEYVPPLWAIRALITRATMRRRFPGLLARFPRDGDPTYTSHKTYRAENWPERATWSREEAAYIGTRFYHWDQRRRRAGGLANA